MAPTLLLLAATIPLNCSDRLPTTQEAICRQPKLLALYRNVEEKTRRLESKLSGRNLYALQDTQRSFFRALNCSGRDKLVACAREKITRRLALLERTETMPDAILEAVTEGGAIDGPYFAHFGQDLIGRKLSVFGCVNLGDEGQPAAERIHAVLKDGSATVPVLFKSMTASQAEFLDEKKPCAHWGGTVEQRDGKIVLYAEDILGAPLK